MVQSSLARLSTIRSRLIERLLTSEELMKAVVHDSTNFLEQPAVVDPEQYLYQRIFPIRHFPGKHVNEQKTVVSVSLENIQSVQREYKSGMICFNVYTHINLCQCESELLRTDFIIRKIDELFHRSQDFGIERLEFEKLDVLKIFNPNYYGDSITYRMLDFAK